MILTPAHHDSARIDCVIDAVSGQRIVARQLQLLDTETMRYEACQLATDSVGPNGLIVTNYACDPATKMPIKVKGTASKIFWKATE